ncbi:hypothetical protein C2845_PM09G09380 [Panicum miliaceum]|uniref:Uncharacterized protein n=1 Tax=Panicum miliaceum TaxID=4540 RepID=A0A3L6S133_PANMI|nr:hypothetical protein C2845_PM09G09380 [Panicum miliaceum]
MSSSWTTRQNKVFEEALAMYDKDTPDRWQKVARAVGGGKTVDDVKMQYKKLTKDVKEMDTEGLQNFQYGSSSNTSMGGSSSSNGQQRALEQANIECRLDIGG